MFIERKEESLAEFLRWLTSQGPEEWEELVFLPQDQPLKQSLHMLHSPLTLSIEEYERWLADGGLLLARTIDGDYIGEKQKQTYYLPRSLVKEDLQIKNLTFLELLRAYEASQKSIASFF
ncbi:hypothetical protein IGI37_001783 [Enterococcus sp. AZ194]|uniref:hypothetical protein n=1 Tax=Enterococcus sp. AZ194 TaxID=2774629 RepID=UPI003F1FDD85